MQQQCDQSQEEIRKLRKENVTLAARTRDRIPAINHNNKSRIFDMRLVIIVIAVMTLINLKLNLVNKQNSDYLPHATIFPAPVTSNYRYD